MLTVYQFHFSRLKVTEHCEQQRERDVEQKLNLTALNKSTQTSIMVLPPVIMMHLASVSVCAEMDLLMFCSFEECLRGVCLIGYPDKG